MKGTIHRLYKTCGYILSGGLEYYFTPKNLGEIEWNQLKTGQEVTFEEMKDPSGIHATGVELVHTVQ